VLRAFRAIIRRAGLHKIRTANQACLSVTANSDGCRLRAASSEIAIEHQLVGEFPDVLFLLPITALDTWNGRGDDSVIFEPETARDVRASWSDHGVPRQATYHVGAEATVDFPEPPANYTANDSVMWQALQDAVTSADHASARYALNCLHLRGSLGRVDATDGRHVLSQSGFRFGFEEDLLVLANPILGCRELATAESIAIARTSDWLGIRVKQCSVMLRIEKEGRFPKIDDLLASHEHAKSRLELSADDLAFLANVIGRLPSDDPQYNPVTLDLNDKVLIRSRDAEQSRPTEVELTSSRLIGEPVVINTDRRYIERAARLGFTEARILGPNSPILCQDDRRKYLWALLSAEGAIRRSDEPIRVESRRLTTTHSSSRKYSKRINSAPYSQRVAG